MSGHSKWSQIRRQKGIADVKKGQEFSKLGKLISIAAKKGADPASNPSLAGMIERARAANMPKDNIERAIKRATDKSASILEEINVQALGPGGIGIVITAITDNKNRTIGEIRNILANHNSKMADEGSLNWQFDQKMSAEGIEWVAKYPLAIDTETQASIEALFEEMDNNEDVGSIFSNLAH
ncbi:MAG: hypothetical protein A3A33_04300 [Candidatus Yanofskybacteria bacterium RIFCSPLOWO2_01_FULL_49_25]|uniref:Transcriptional regulator n=1 Tax=Candidatus Yanofskybacteria bacterium RIFCSPLOWO2_01_FULL_49_25 TaxID=1802701 RepID=A0A1F8GRL9_9BACT|nr:MAG: hypothetical protein A3A33_04300 [Candidatus Yanofskybacteria bacterium RIFCSPLOWO2_01_FULL_49_25]